MPKIGVVILGIEVVQIQELIKLKTAKYGHNDLCISSLDY
jgi:hypothetical protein